MEVPTPIIRVAGILRLTTLAADRALRPLRRRMVCATKSGVPIRFLLLHPFVSESRRRDAWAGQTE